MKHALSIAMCHGVGHRRFVKGPFGKGSFVVMCVYLPCVAKIFHLLWSRLTTQICGSEKGGVLLVQ